MDVQTILDYIGETPENTNTNILTEMLAELQEEGVDEYRHFYASSQEDLAAFKEYVEEYSTSETYHPIKAILHITKNDETEVTAAYNTFDSFDSEAVTSWMGVIGTNVFCPSNHLIFNNDPNSGALQYDAFIGSVHAIYGIDGQIFISVETDSETGDSNVIVGSLENIETIKFTLEWDKNRSVLME